MPATRLISMRFACLLALACACALAAIGPAGAASSSVAVTMSVASATSISATGCASSTPGVTAFGTVLPGTTAMTTADCVVTFGSTNDTSQLRTWQTDRMGRAAWAPPTGVLDTDTGDGDHFSTDGIHVVDPSAAVNDKGYEIATQANGDVIAFGYQSNGDHDFVVSRITAAGVTDTTFGGGGTGSRTISIDPTYDDDPQAIGVYPDDRILLGGVTYVGGTEEDTVLVRLLANGTPDPAWGGGTGILTFDFGGDGFDDEVEHIHIDDQGRVTMLVESDDLDRCMLVRLTDAGTLDTSWGGGDGISDNLDHATETYQCEGFERDSAGRWLIGGERPTSRPMVARFLEDGRLDTSFGTGGVTALATGVADDINAVAELADGKVVIVGARTNAGQRDGLLVRFSSTGVPDAGFGAGGLRVVPFHATAIDELYGVQAMPDGSLIASGYTTDPVGGDFDPVLYKALGDAAGTAATNFGPTSNGRLMVDTPLLDEVWGSAIWGDGKLMLIGEASGSPAAMGTMRLDTVRLGDFANGSSDWGVGSTSLFGACLASAGNGATAGAGVGGWTAAGSCSLATSAPWRGIAARSGSAGAKVAAATTGMTLGAEVRLRFGVRVAPGQQPGAYYAPITFETLAPNA